ncbi:hypothetical protein E2C01_068412 [Portunus trituberculatus]|uniref:Uncharacterized protein n=1 Tax=Portunus trituberculatus TaxID=210409 RepID=A0A5B7HXT2_PORTR|nr:hypothetical protein [Portunus trituberculatus]
MYSNGRTIAKMKGRRCSMAPLQGRTKDYRIVKDKAPGNLMALCYPLRGRQTNRQAGRQAGRQSDREAGVSLAACTCGCGSLHNLRRGHTHLDTSTVINEARVYCLPCGASLSYRRQHLAPAPASPCIPAFSMASLPRQCVDHILC